MIRKFKIVNSANETYDLYDIEHFGYNPDNLGASLTNTFVQSGANFLLTGTNLNTQQFQINVIFGGEEQKDQYELHRDLFVFLNKPPLKLLYERPNLDVMTRDIALANFPLSEIKEPFLIDSQLTFDFLTPFYRYILFTSQADGDFIENSGKLYAFNVLNDNEPCYTYSPMRTQATDTGTVGYVYDVKGRISKSITIINNSTYLNTQQTSSMIIEISTNDYISSPIEWELYVDDALVQNDAYFTDLQPGEKIVVNSSFQSQEATKIDVNGVGSSVYQEQDLTKSNFITAPLGQSTFICKNDNVNIKIWLKEETLL